MKFEVNWSSVKHGAKELKYSIVTYSVVYFLIFNLLNYYNLYDGQSTLPMVDIPSYLSETKENSGNDIYQVMVDIYLRKQSDYIENIDSTVIVTPKIKLSKTNIDIVLTEGLYDFTDKQVIEGSDGISTLFTKKLSFGVGDFTDKGYTSYINSILQPIVPSNVLHRFGDLDKLVFLTHLSNLMIMLTSVIMVIMIMGIGPICQGHKIRTRVYVSIFLVIFITLLTFQLLDLVVLGILDVTLHWVKPKKWLIMCFEVGLNILLSFEYYYLCVEYLFPQPELNDEHVNPYKETTEPKSSSVVLDSTKELKPTTLQTNPTSSTDPLLIHKTTSTFREQYSDSSSVYPPDSPQTTTVVPQKQFRFPGNTKAPYTGPVALPKSASSQRNPLSRSFTAPFPLSSEGSDSSGFEQIKAAFGTESGKNSPLKLNKPLPFDPSKLEQLIEDSRKEADLIQDSLTGTISPRTLGFTPKSPPKVPVNSPASTSLKNNSSTEAEDSDGQKEELTLKRFPGGHGSG